MKEHPREACKPEILYPCCWVYKVIGRDPEQIRGAIAEIMGSEAHTVAVSRRSAGGNYLCMNLETTVESESARIGLYERLKQHPDVVAVL